MMQTNHFRDIGKMVKEQTLKLYHYSEQPLKEVQKPENKYKYFKPNGLWVSDDDDYSWKEWCKDNDFRVEKLKYKTEIILKPCANILIIDTLDKLDAFHNEYDGDNDRFGLAWPLVAERYDGIIISPYRHERRLQYLWYYGWDCASGCIWNPDVIEIGATEQVCIK